MYEAYYSVDAAGMSDWNRRYSEYSVPVLAGLVEEGLIEGFGQSRHHTGGDDYNIRTVVRTFDWASLNILLGRIPVSPPGGDPGGGVGGRQPQRSQALRRDLGH